MLKQTSSRFTMGVLVVAAVMLAVAGTSIASNMGFKLNKPLALTLNPSQAGQQGNNWISIPFFNPYPNVGSFCQQLGLASTGLITVHAATLQIDPTNNAQITATCGTAAANTTLLTAGRGIRVRNPFNQPAPAVTSAIVVGSHNPALTITGPKASGSIGNLWFSVPYHTTAVTFADLCNSGGLTSTGLITSRGQIQRLDASTGAFVSSTCGTADAGTKNLVLGEAVQLRDPTKAISFIPAHF